MLTRLTIENIALVDHADRAFGPGMTALTGETGAGKSVIVTALALALGDRADREFIRHRADQATVRATFDISTLPAAARRAFTEWTDSNEIEALRTITRNGNSRVSLGGKKATLAQLRAVMAPVGEILSQHATQALMDESNHLGFLDEYASLFNLADTVADAFERWSRVAEELRRTRRTRDRLVQERELLLFQRKEIEEADITIGEEEKLQTERKILDSARALMASASQITAGVDGEDGSILESLAAVVRELDAMTAIDPDLQTQTQELFDVRERLQDFSRFIEQYGRSVEDNPARIDEINERLDEIYRLKQKYGGSEEAISASLDRITAALAIRPDTDSRIAELETKTAQLFEEYSRQAVKLSKKRLAASRKLQKAALRELADLAIEDAQFELAFDYENDPDGVALGKRRVKPQERGLETIRFMFSANAGEPVKSLVKTASGGEMSRVLLALKAAAAAGSKQGHSLLVFDEIDAGIGGRTAVEVGRKLKDLAKRSQVIVITHLHQIARLADHHLLVEKARQDQGRNVISLRDLDAKDRRTELDRMIALPEGESFPEGES